MARIDDYLPWRVLQFVTTVLADIDPSGGYNTTPTVYDDIDEFEASTEEWQIMVDAERTQVRVDGATQASRTNPTFVVQVTGVARYGNEKPRMRCMMLEQDVRTALHGAAKDGSLRDALGRGCSLRFGDGGYDMGALAPDKEAGFRLAVNFTWSQGSDW